MILWLFFIGIMSTLGAAYQVGGSWPSEAVPGFVVLAWIAHIAFWISMVVSVGGQP